MRGSKLALALSLCALLATLAVPAWGANIVVLDFDPPGIGFNDPTPVAPVGGNPGVTRGEQRRIVMQFAADIWGAVLESDVTIFVIAQYTPLPCNANAAVLGQAGTTFVFLGFPPGPPTVLPGVLYHSALADKLAGFDLNPGSFDIGASFNGAIDDNPNCLAGLNWYYGLDNAAPAGTTDLLNTATHELGHGLGFANFVNEATGTQFAGFPDIYSVFTFDNTQGLYWPQMTDAERVASAINTGNVVWDGPSVNAQTANFLGNQTVMLINSPAAIAGTYGAQAADFGPALDNTGITGSVVLADDGTGTATDGCEALVNGGAVSGNIALIDRGNCPFTVKVANAQAAGAIGAIVANNVAGGPAPMGGADPAVTIPSIGLTLADGNTIKAELPGVNVTMRLDPNLLSGADADGRALLYAPPVVSLGSTISHWDTSATPNLLMEPFATGDIRSSESLDMTPFQMEDIGWTLVDSDGDGVADVIDACPASDTSPTVVIDGCDSGVPNTLFGDGCNISDGIAACAAGAGNHGGFVSCVAQYGNDLKKAGVISGKQKGAIQSCAAGSSLP